MAELLIKAEKHWMDDLSLEAVNNMTMRMKDDYEARTQIGDIIVIKPDGWVWGKEECLPRFLIIQLPGIEVSAIEHFVKALNKEEERVRIIEVEKYIWDNDTSKNNFITKFGFTKTPQVILSKSDSYLISASKNEQRMLKRHKYRIPETWVKNKVSEGKSMIEIKNAAEKQTLIDSVLEKTS